MNSIDFCYWLQGYFEISGNKVLSPYQVNIVQNHLNLVFKHQLDDLVDGGDDKVKKTLQDIHDGDVPHLSNDKLIRC